MQTPSISTQQLNAASAEDFAAILAGPPEQTAAWLRTAAEGGVGEAQAVYAQMLLDGQGVKQDLEQAAYWFKRAAEGNHPMAMNMLGQCHHYAWGVPHNAVLAAYWYQLAARAGLDWGMYNYATALALGEGITENRAQALVWFRRAADLGHAKSINIVGGFHEDGWEGPIDMEAAFDHYRRAALGGDFRGQFNYARLLIERAELSEALLWLESVPATATPAFLEKTIAFLSQSPHAAVREKGQWMRQQLMPRT